MARNGWLSTLGRLGDSFVKKVAAAGDLLIATPEQDLDKMRDTFRDWNATIGKITDNQVYLKIRDVPPHQNGNDERRFIWIQVRKNFPGSSQDSLFDPEMHLKNAYMSVRASENGTFLFTQKEIVEGQGRLETGVRQVISSLSAEEVYTLVSREIQKLAEPDQKERLAAELITQIQQKQTQAAHDQTDLSMMGFHY